jgi:hypothetical protein
MLLLVSMAAPSFATNRLVPSQYATIQNAIDNCNTGDIVILDPNTYTGPGNRDIDFKGLAITVRSVNPNDPCIVAATIIDCNGTGRGFIFYNGENQNSVLAGLTITNAYIDASGGGIYCGYNSSPTIINCIFKNNSARWGGGLKTENSSPTIRNCIFTGNSAQNTGGGMHNISSKSVVRNCIFTGNSAGVGGGGFLTNFLNDPNLHPTLTNCIFWGNQTQGSSPEIWSVASADITYCDVKGGFPGLGNINADPCFVDSLGGNYHLRVDSPCFNTGDPCYYPTFRETDIDGESRIMGGRVDMGVDEISSTPTSVIGVSQVEFMFSAVKGDSNPPGQILAIRNYGGGALNWQISESCSWLSASPDSGSSTGEVNEVTLSADISGMGWENYNCELTVSDPCAINNPQTIDVTLTVTGPIIELSASDFHFSANRDGNNPTGQVLGIRNSNLGTLNWQISESCSWLEVVPDSGSSTGEIDEVAINIDISGLTGGTYNCALMISDPCALNNPQTSDVNLVVYGPEIELSATELRFFACEAIPDPNDKVFTIRNSGVATLDWSVNYDCNWLQVDPNTGSSTGEPNEVIVSVDTTGMSKGDYYEYELIVSDPTVENSPQTVWVNLTFEVAVADFDSDCDVTMVDFSIFASAWLSELGYGNWNPDCDISDPNDNIINELDLAVFCDDWLAGVE